MVTLSSNKSTPLVSIMMPVYNGRRLIEASIHSIIQQTYLNWECIIVDDGSTDSTKEYVDGLPYVDKRFKIIHHPQNMGRSAARQTALDAAKGKYLAMLDAEDMWHPNKLEYQVKYLEDNDEVALVVCGMISFGTSTNVLRERGYKHNDVIRFTRNNVPIHASSLLRLEIAKSYQYDKTLSLGEDADFLKRYLENRYFATQKESLYYYSEFDSVSKIKILNTIKRILSKSIREQRYLSAIKSLLKLAIFYLIYPFISIETILKARGHKPEKSNIDFFENHIRPLINSAIKR